VRVNYDRLEFCFDELASSVLLPLLLKGQEAGVPGPENFLNIKQPFKTVHHQRSKEKDSRHLKIFSLK
jgi:hypothetical protein